VNNSGNKKWMRDEGTRGEWGGVLIGAMSEILGIRAKRYIFYFIYLQL